MNYEFLLLALEMIIFGVIFIGFIVNSLRKRKGISCHGFTDSHRVTRPHDTYTDPILADFGPNIWNGL